MLDRLSNPAKIKAYYLAEELKGMWKDLYLKHMDDIESGEFSRVMMEDWANGDVKLHTWRDNFANVHLRMLLSATPRSQSRNILTRIF